MIFHLAAIIGVVHVTEKPYEVLYDNIELLSNMIDLAKHQKNLKRFLFASTSEVYGTAQFVPITENHPLHGQSPYSASKIGADQLAMSFYNSFGTPVSILRPFNIYGPRQSARAVIPTIITQIANDQGQINLGSLHPTRDFNYVEDISSGFVAALESDKAIGEVINLGSGFEISIGDTAKLIANLMESKTEIRTDSQRLRPKKSEVERLFAENAKAKKLLEKKQLLFGTIDTFLLWRLTKGKTHATDATNASRTMLYNINTNKWDNQILKSLKIPHHILPTIKNSSDDFGRTHKSITGKSYPITGVVGDQQAATIDRKSTRLNSSHW